jgi:hypothetical protein
MARFKLDCGSQSVNGAFKRFGIFVALAGAVFFVFLSGSSPPTGSAGHAGATDNLKLTFRLDHSAGADHPRLARPPLCDRGDELGAGLDVGRAAKLEGTAAA